MTASFKNNTHVSHATFENPPVQYGRSSGAMIFFFPHSSLYHSYRELYCFMMSAVKRSKLFLSFFLSLVLKRIRWCLTGVYSSYIVNQCCCFTWEPLCHLVCNQLSGHRYCMCLQWEYQGCVTERHMVSLSLFPCICTNTPWKQVGSNCW